MNILELENRDYFCGMFVSHSGAGKSCAVASFARLGKMKIFDLSKRARGILGIRSILGEELLSRIDIAQDITTYEDLRKQFEILLVHYKSGKRPYETIVIEDVATLGKLLIFDSQRLRGVQKENQRILGTLAMTDPSDFNYCSQAFMKLLYHYIQPLPCNFILSAWLTNRYGKNPEGDYLPNVITGTKILTTDKWADEVPGYFDEVYLFLKEDPTGGGNQIKHSVQFQSDLAKTSREYLKRQVKMDLTNKLFYDEYLKVKEMYGPKSSSVQKAEAK